MVILLNAICAVYGNYVILIYLRSDMIKETWVDAKGILIIINECPSVS